MPYLVYRQFSAGWPLIFPILDFSQAMKVQERSLDELPFISQTGVKGSWYGFIVLFLVLIARLTSLFPLGGSGASAESFFEGTYPFQF